MRAIRPELKELDIEFAVHEDAGPAINFALNAKVGDYIGITNPGGPDPLLAPRLSLLYGSRSQLITRFNGIN